MSSISIQGLDTAKVLASLYNNAKVHGRGIHNPAGSSELTVAQAREILNRQTYFDYLNGRVLKIDLAANTGELNVRLYNRDNGTGKAERVIEHLRNTDSIEEII